MQRDELVVDESRSIVTLNVFAGGQLRGFDGEFFKQLRLLGKQHIAVRSGT
jgi:hypothetical protein